MSDTHIDSWQAREAAALDAAIETRRHMRACRTCQAGGELCATGRERLAAVTGGLRGLGDHMAARARVARAISA